MYRMLGKRERLTIKFADDEIREDCGILRRRGEGITTASIIMRGDLGMRSCSGVESDMTTTVLLSLLACDLRGFVSDGRQALALTWGGVGRI